uniref:LAGLIDADG homing endonuclease n=1 Tax=Romanomermis culicivorax TaxID=13658 RepID=A0A915KDL4_ROMCU
MLNIIIHIPHSQQLAGEITGSQHLSLDNGSAAGALRRLAPRWATDGNGPLTKEKFFSFNGGGVVACQRSLTYQKAEKFREILSKIIFLEYPDRPIVHPPIFSSSGSWSRPSFYPIWLDFETSKK